MHSIFGSGALAGYSDDPDKTAILVATAFYPAGGSDGWTANGVRIWIGGTDADLHGAYAYLYESAMAGNTANLKAVKALPSPLVAGWNEVNFDAPVALTEFPGGKVYVAAVYLPHGGYAYKTEVFDFDVVSPDDANLIGMGGADGTGALGAAGSHNGLFVTGTIADPANPPATITTWAGNASKVHYGVDVLVADPADPSPDPPVNTAAPAITGTAQTGSTLSCSTGSWSGAPTSYAYQWQRNGADIVGATAGTYLLTEADEGASIRCGVTATNANGSVTAYSGTVIPTAPAAPGGGLVSEAELAVRINGQWLTLGKRREPWQFPVRDYGAVGDGKVITDADMTSGSATLTSATAGFTSADVGKAIMVNNAGPARDADHSGCLFSTIAAVVDATTVTLANAALATVTDMSAVYGTDDTAAIQAAVAAIQASPYFTAPPRYAELLFDPLIYCLATPPTPGGDPDNLTYGNAQIPLPVVDLTGAKAKPTIVIKGGTLDNSTLDSYHQAEPQINGTTLMSMIEVNAYDATYGPPSVIGGPTVDAPFGGGNFFNNVLVVIDAIQIVCPVNPGQIALDFFKMAQFAIKTASLDVFAGVISTPAVEATGSGPLNQRGQGLRMNDAGLNDRCDVDSLSIEGYYYGMSVDEHLAAQRVAIIYCKIAIYVPAHGGNQASHGAWIGYASTEICDYCVWVQNAPGSLFGLVIDALDNEGPVVAHIYDPSNYLTGRINILPSNSDNAPQYPIVTGAGNLEIKNLSGIRGSLTDNGVAIPAIPATNTLLQNPFWRDATVYITGGTVTAIHVDGELLGVTSGPVTVPSGKNISLSYSVAPTWKWVLL